MRACLAAGVLIVGALVGVANPAGASESPGQCVDYSPLGYCIDWDVPTPGGPPAGGGGGGSNNDVVCSWVTIPDPSGDDPSVFYDFNVAPPPADVTVVWQALECSDGTPSTNLRWIVPLTPENIASSVRGRIVGALPQPMINSSPPIGTASIVDVAVFVEVTNWTDAITDSECAGGLCVTVSATPTLTFTPGEPGSNPVSCAGSGTRYEQDGPSIEEQAAADGACAYAYRLRTGIERRPVSWPGTASVTWVISWTASTGASGSLPAVTRTTQIPRSVREVQAVVVGGETA